MDHSVNSSRRKLLGASVAATGLAGAGSLLSVEAFAQDKAKVNMQLGWISGGNRQFGCPWRDAFEAILAWRRRRVVWPILSCRRSIRH